MRSAWDPTGAPKSAASTPVPVAVADHATTAGTSGNASSLLGNTWAAPGAIGGTTPGSGTFSTLASGVYTVATLPTGSAGMRSFVSNALTPSFGVAVTGGGAVGVPVYHDGVSWKVG